MNGKRLFVAAMVLSMVLVAFTASSWQTRRVAKDSRGMALTGPSGKFGPMIETVLPAAKSKRPTEILDVETGGALLQPSIEDFDFRADAIMTWIRSSGLDISCFVWPGGAACITYDMTIIAVEGKCWEETTEKELFNNPALAPGRHAPRRLLVVGHNRPDTYLFRTGDGTLGMLRIVGLSQQGAGVKIRYKLINPSQAFGGKAVPSRRSFSPPLVLLGLAIY